MADYSRLEPFFVDLYGAQAGASAYRQACALLERWEPQIAQAGVHPGRLNSGDAILITYGDQIRQTGEAPLQTLAAFCLERLRGAISAIHILPFFPYSSDDGFSVIDYRSVDLRLGSWEDVQRLGGSFRLMIDGVINHISSQSAWFQGFLRGDPRYRDFFIRVSPGADLSRVVRPRALPLLTAFDTSEGEQSVWTTFSADQIDLNYANPAVLLEILDVLLAYVCHGAQLIRLDAIAYLWKEVGTACIHLPQTHRVVQLLRAVLDEVAPYVLLVTETNVPHAENLSYFGDGTNEAQLVYNFTLPPLVLHTFLSGSASQLSEWASGLKLPSKEVTFFNFLASHDGIGLNPVRGILSSGEIDALVEACLARGGLIGRKQNPDGTQSPYELNINYFDALTPVGVEESLERQVDRFMASQAILLALAGVPGIYVHSLLGSRGWPEGVRQTGRNRTINRQKFERGSLAADLADPLSRRRLVFERYIRLLRARAASPAFDPYGGQSVVESGQAGVFALLRYSPGEARPALCLVNVSGEALLARPGLKKGDFPSARCRDRIGGQGFELGEHPVIGLLPYQVMWLEPE